MTPPRPAPATREEREAQGLESAAAPGDPPPLVEPARVPGEPLTIESAAELLGALIYNLRAEGRFARALGLAAEAPSEYRERFRLIAACRGPDGEIVVEATDRVRPEWIGRELGDMDGDRLLDQIEQVFRDRQRRDREAEARRIMADSARPLRERAAELALLAEAEPVRSPSVPRPIPVRDVLALGVEQIPYLVEGIIPEAEPVLWAGAGGASKSWAVLELARTVSGAEDGFLGVSVNRRGPVLILDRENGARRLCLRSRRLGIQPDAPVWFLTDDAAARLYVNDPGFPDRLLSILDTMKPPPILLALDSWTRFSTADENASREVAQAMENLWMVCRRSGASIILVHHWNKAGEGAAVSRVRGSVDFVNSVSCALSFERREDVTRIEQTKPRDGPYIDPIGFRIAPHASIPGRLVLALVDPPARKPSAVEAARAAIRRAVLAGPVFLADLERQGAGSRQTLRRAAEELERTEEITIVRDGVQGRVRGWTLTTRLGSSPCANVVQHG